MSSSFEQDTSSQSSHVDLGSTTDSSCGDEEGSSVYMSEAEIDQKINELRGSNVWIATQTHMIAWAAINPSHYVDTFFPYGQKGGHTDTDGLMNVIERAAIATVANRLGIKFDVKTTGEMRDKMRAIALEEEIQYQVQVMGLVYEPTQLLCWMAFKPSAYVVEWYDTEQDSRPSDYLTEVIAGTVRHELLIRVSLKEEISGAVAELRVEELIQADQIARNYLRLLDNMDLARVEEDTEDLGHYFTEEQTMDKDRCRRIFCKAMDLELQSRQDGYWEDDVIPTPSSDLRINGYTSLIPGYAYGQTPEDFGFEDGETGISRFRGLNRGSRSRVRCQWQRHAHRDEQRNMHNPITHGSVKEEFTNWYTGETWEMPRRIELDSPIIPGVGYGTSTKRRPDSKRDVMLDDWAFDEMMAIQEEERRIDPTDIFGRTLEEADLAEEELLRYEDPRGSHFRPGHDYWDAHQSDCSCRSCSEFPAGMNKAAGPVTGDAYVRGDKAQVWERRSVN
jgi:hypothetical protein